jgi:hypothetical protein
MKTLTIGDCTIEVAESAEDLSPVRYTAIKTVVAKQTSGLEMPDLVTFFSSRREMYNSSDLFGLMASEMNFVQQLQTQQTTIAEDASVELFGIICFEPDEDKTSYDSTKSTEKLKRLCAAGLTMGDVWREVTGFINASPQLSVSFFLTSLEAIKTQRTLSEILP